MISEIYRAKHLLLLVGTNPLPNLVAAQLLLAENGVVYLICSEETARVADHLYRYLDQQHVKVQMPGAIKATDAQDIETTITKLVRGLDGKVGLHYTGGTKAMAVHAYRAVERTLTHGAHAPVFSYLDANTFELRIDPDYHEKVLLEVSPKLRDIVTLHGNPLKAGLPSQDSVMLPVAQALAQSAGAGGIAAWRNWCADTLRSKAHTGRRWKSKTVLRALEPLLLPNDPVLQNAMTTLKAELGLPAEATTLPLDTNRLHSNFKEPEQLCAWLDGDWLEYYVLDQVGAVAEACQLHDWGRTLDTDEKSDADFNFEFDVAALRGYQLFGMSCSTTTNKSLAKSKLFEAYIRARQLGGDEARVGLVCGYEYPNALERELSQSWDAEGKIRVFGPQDLPDLSTRLAAWFQTAK